MLQIPNDEDEEDKGSEARTGTPAPQVALAPIS
jgi:hypothetical protein